MELLKHLINCFLIWLLLDEIVGALCKDLTEKERATKAAFIQNLINKQKRLEGKIRLVGGNNDYEGNVYIYHAGRWGAVCDDSWDDAAAQVVCRGFNRTGVSTQGGQYGIATRKFWMDDIVCQGEEKNLFDCIFTGWGSSDCEPSEAAGVVCTEIKRENEVPLNIVEVDEEKLLIRDVLDVKSASLRLIGGRNHKEGRVEIYQKGVWGSICHDGWTLYEASVVCRHLGLGFAQQAIQTNYFGNSTLVLSGVQCEGNESNLFMCKHRGYRNVACTGEPGYVAAVVCTHQLADLVIDTSIIERTSHLQDIPLFQLQCAMEENCLSKTAYEIKEKNPDWQFETRRLLRFTASSLNVGNDDFRPYLPKHLWQWHLCHLHYHSMEVFATFDILNSTGHRIAEGHKASFCLEDNTCLPGVEKKYSCKNYGDQGVSVNCSDIYQYNIDCQWVDVTDVEPGDYIFKIAVNPHARIAEQSYHNNAASCQLRLSDSYVSVYGCELGRP